MSAGFDGIGLQAALVLGCKPVWEAIGMRAAGQGHDPSPLVGEGLGRGGAVASIGCCVSLCAAARYLGREFVPHAEILSFASPKESIQRKGDPTFAPFAALRVPCASRLKRRLRNSRPAAAQTVLADYPVSACDARRSRREPVRGGASHRSLGLQWIFVGCNQRASALHRMPSLSKTSGAMRCASIAPYLGIRRSDFSPTATLNKHRVGLKSDLQGLRWSRVGNSLPTQHGGQQAAHPTQAGQAWSLASQWISPVGHAEHRRKLRGCRRGLSEQQTAGLMRVPQPPQLSRSTGNPQPQAEGVTFGSPSLGYLSWRDKKGTVPAGHPRHLNQLRVSAPNQPESKFSGSTPSPQPLSRKGRGAAPLQPALLLPRKHARKPIPARPAGLPLNGGRHA
jgi:hypothetical protein